MSPIGTRAGRKEWRGKIYDTLLSLGKKSNFFHGQLPRDIQWHFIGHLQSNKCKAVAG